MDIFILYITEAAYGRMDVEEALAKIQEESAELDLTSLQSR